MSITVLFGRFEWDREKEILNIQTHHLDFYSSCLVFLDPDRLIVVDEQHSTKESRFFCIGILGNKIATVRFTTRDERIRIIGAGFWRKGKKFYEEENTKKSKRR